MTLIIDNDAVESVLTMSDCIGALDHVFREYSTGGAVNRPRSHTYTTRGDGRFYLFKSMDGGIASLGVHAIRISSDLTHEFERDGLRRREKIPAAPGQRWVGLVMLFDMETLVPLAIMQDGYLQRMRVGATSGLAAKNLARPDARSVGMIGTGWQAGAQLLALHELGTIEEYRVFSTDEGRCRRFCAEFSERLGLEVRPVASARDAVDAVDIVALATNSHDPVLDGAWLSPGQHVGSVQGHELDERTLGRADLVVVRSREEATFHYAPGEAPLEASGRKVPDEETRAKMVELGDVLLGREGRRSGTDLTLFVGGGTGASSGLGIQFTAVANAVYRAVRAAGLGHEVPTEWFTEDRRP